MALRAAPTSTDRKASSTSEIPTNSACGAGRDVQHAPHADPEEEERVAQPHHGHDRHHRQQQRGAGEHHRNRAVGGDLERGEVVAHDAEHRRYESEDAGKDEDRADRREVRRGAGGLRICSAGTTNPCTGSQSRSKVFIPITVAIGASNASGRM